MLHQDDDANFHKPGPENDWREAYYCNFEDVSSDLCGVAWQGARVNQGHGEAVFLLVDGHRELIRSINFDFTFPPNTVDPSRKMGPQEFVCVEPWRRWDIHYKKGADDITVRWSQLTDVCDWEWGDITNQSKRFEYSGRIEVTGVVAGRPISFNGYGQRDRSWGSRSYGPLEYGLNMAAQFPDDAAVHAFLLKMGDGTVRLMGYLHMDNKTVGLKSCEVTVKHSDERGPPISGSYNFVDQSGRHMEIDSFSIINHLGFGVRDEDPSKCVLDVSKPKSLMFLTWQRYVRRDGVSGRGYMDANYQVGKIPSRMSAGPPLYSTLYSYGR